MRFSELTRRLTGLNVSVAGVSWQASESEITSARRIITYLGDRRVLYDPTQLETPSHCVASVIEIRKYLSEELGKIDQENALALNLRAMRAACRKFLDATQRIEVERYGLSLELPMGVQHMDSYGSWLFGSALGEMRGVFGIHVVMIAARNRLGVERNLASIIPIEDASQ